jgi:hypothetical protein
MYFEKHIDVFRMLYDDIVQKATKSYVRRFLSLKEYKFIFMHQVEYEQDIVFL